MRHNTAQSLSWHLDLTKTKPFMS